MHIMLPVYQPPVQLFGASQEDGPGYSYVVYFVLSDAGRREIEEQSTSAARLYKRFCEGYHTEGLHRRLKAIVKVANMDEVDFGSTWNAFMRSYNGKPFLTGPKFHTFYEGDGYLEVDVDVHRFCFLARKATASFIPHFCQLVLDVAFVVEGHDDEEQPEQVLGCLRMSKIDAARTGILEDPNDPDAML
jgi:hypothetical protein